MDGIEGLRKGHILAIGPAKLLSAGEVNGPRGLWQSGAHITQKLHRTELMKEMNADGAHIILTDGSIFCGDFIVSSTEVSSTEIKSGSAGHGSAQALSRIDGSVVFKISSNGSITEFRGGQCFCKHCGPRTPGALKRGCDEGHEFGSRSTEVRSVHNLGGRAQHEGIECVNKYTVCTEPLARFLHRCLHIGMFVASSHAFFGGLRIGLLCSGVVLLNAWKDEDDRATHSGDGRGSNGPHSAHEGGGAGEDKVTISSCDSPHLSTILTFGNGLSLLLWLIFSFALLQSHSC